MAKAMAMAQMRAVMAAPTEQVTVVVLHADGTSTEAMIDHRKVGELLGGTPTICGAIRALDAQAVAKDGAAGKVNTHVLPSGSFEPKIKGDIVLLRTANDEVGSPLGLPLAEFLAWVEQGMPEGDDSESEESEGSEDESDEDEEGEEGEEGEESGDEDESDEEDEAVDLAKLPLDQLRDACKHVGISHKGSREQLIERFEAHAKQQTEKASESEEAEDEAAPAKAAPEPARGSKRGRS
jgi:hypothetical protein